MNVVSSRVNHPVFFTGHGFYKASKLGGFMALGLPVITSDYYQLHLLNHLNLPLHPASSP